MKKNDTMFNAWTIDFRKALFCLASISLGVLYSLKEPKALAIAIIVQCASNIDGFWDYLIKDELMTLIKIMTVIMVFLSFVAGLIAIFDLGNSNELLCAKDKINIWIIVELVFTGFPVILLSVDAIANIKKKSKPKTNDRDGGEDDGL